MLNNNIDKELEVAVYERDLKKVRALLSAGADPNFQPNRENKLPHQYGNKLLHYVNSVEIAKELLLYGALVDSRNMYNETPLHTAMTCGRTAKLIRQLLKHGADVNAKDRKGNTPLNLAIKTSNKDLEVIRELLEYGADINIRNCERRLFDNHSTPLDNAMSYPECAELLIKITLIKNFDKDYRKIINLDPYKERSYYSKLSSYLDNCICEIIKMKTDCINNILSLYEFITLKETNKEVLYVNDEGVKSIRNRVFQVLTSTNYPIYRDVILAKIGASLERASLLNKLSELEVYTKSDASDYTQGVQEKTVVLDSYSKHEVAQYLSNNDLLSFIVAFYGCTDQPLCSKRNFAESGVQPNTRLYEASTSNYTKRARLE